MSRTKIWISVINHDRSKITQIKQESAILSPRRDNNQDAVAACVVEQLFSEREFFKQRIPERNCNYSNRKHKN